MLLEPTQNFKSVKLKVRMVITVMVYCSSCGVKNGEDAEFCVNCGASLYPVRGKKIHEDTCFGRRERRVEDECFGLPYGGAIAGVVFGVFIILIGLAIAFGFDIWSLIGPFILIIFGVLIIAGAIYGLRKYRS